MSWPRSSVASSARVVAWIETHWPDAGTPCPMDGPAALLLPEDQDLGLHVARVEHLKQRGAVGYVTTVAGDQFVKFEVAFLNGWDAMKREDIEGLLASPPLPGCHCSVCLRVRESRGELSWA